MCGKHNDELLLEFPVGQSKSDRTNKELSRDYLEIDWSVLEELDCGD